MTLSKLLLASTCAIAIAAATGTPALAWSIKKPLGNLGHAVETIAHQVGDAVETAAHQTGDAVETATHQTGNALETAAHQTGDAVEIAAHQTGEAVEKAAHDTGKTIEKAVHDVGDAGVSVYNFGINEIKAIGETVGDAADRLEEGKFVDAVWHLATDPVKHTEENAAKMAQESNLVRVAGQIAASVYGGPGGAAAYAAWLTYSQTDDLNMALRVGAITGAAAWATGGVSNLPDATAAEIAQKTILAGAIGGVAVAAAGGDQQAIQEGFLKAGGAMLIQTIYEDQTEHELDARPSKGPAYCMATTNIDQPCAPEIEAYSYEENGEPITGKEAKVDVRHTDPRAPHVGTWADSADGPVIGSGETSTFMVTISKYPGMNAMALLHDHLSYTLKFDPVTNVWSIVPATVFTYYGTDAPTEDAIREAAQN